MIGDFFRQGVKNLTNRRLRSWLTMIGIFIGVALVVSLISLGQGMQDAIVGQFSDLGADTITIQAAGGGYGPPGTYQSVKVTEDDLEVVKRTRGVDEAFGRIIGPVKVTVDDEEEYGYISTVAENPDEYDLSVTTPDELVAEQGRMIEPGDRHEVVAGYRLGHESLYERNLVPGDEILINDQEFDIVGVLEKTGNPQLDSILWMMEDAGREVTGTEEAYGLIVAKVVEGVDPNVVKERLMEELRDSRDVEEGKEDFSVTTAQETIDSLNSILGAVKWFLIGIAAISLLVGGVGITNTMYTSVLERTREIGIMKAIGAKNGDVLTIFLIESGLLGLVGGLIGIALGLGFAAAVAAIARQALGADIIQAYVSFGLLAGAMLGSFLVGSIAGLTPARQASRMKPVEALQYG
ncbi:ABC transporter permease [Candidatus Woesearchaeota archaeon]|nr:ABC transporter permease [Candidatus Woesearchaeota archaeon]